MKLLLALTIFLASTLAAATPHSIYFNGRTGNSTVGVFISESASLEYSQHSHELESGDIKTSNWFGSGITTEMGLEIEKFIQISVNHTFINSQRIGNSAENLRGFRLAPEIKAIFSSPAFNIEFGTGVTGAKLDYQDCSTLTSVQGFGTFISTGFSYYFARSVAFNLEFMKLMESLRKVDGDTDVKFIKEDSVSANIGIRINF